MQIRLNLQKKLQKNIVCNKKTCETGNKYPIFPGAGSEADWRRWFDSDVRYDQRAHKGADPGILQVFFLILFGIVLVFFSQNKFFGMKEVFFPKNYFSFIFPERTCSLV